ncbi:MFS transporter [Streptomyces sp. NPDC048248]|uniref:MFS transporter n=1 Tax=Streptomyces sp. NPDC048248 TaxID=3365523 RepID=UPI0037233FC7
MADEEPRTGPARARQDREVRTTNRRDTRRAAHHAVLVTFLVNGMMLATWLVMIPSVKERTGLSTGALGVVLTLPVVGSLLAMQISCLLVPRCGTRSMLRGSVPVLALLLWAVGLSGNGAQLGGVLFVFGLVDGLVYVTMTSQAIAVEKRSGRSRMNLYHAAWGLGTLAGSLLGGLSAWIGGSVAVHLFATGLLCLVPTIATARNLLADEPASTSLGAGKAPRARAGRRGQSILLLGCLGMVCLMSQGAVEQWGAVYLREERQATSAAASLGFIVFSAALVLGRLGGDALRERSSVAFLLRAFSTLACLGMVLVVAAPSVWWATAGFGLFGAGLSILDPVISSLSGHQAAAPGEHADTSVASAVANVATLSHMGLLLGPPFIGWLGEWLGLTPAMAVPAVLVLVVGACAGRVTEPGRPAALGERIAAGSSGGYEDDGGQDLTAPMASTAATLRTDGTAAPPAQPVGDQPLDK